MLQFSPPLTFTQFSILFILIVFDDVANHLNPGKDELSVAGEPQIKLDAYDSNSEARSNFFFHYMSPWPIKIQVIRCCWWQACRQCCPKYICMRDGNADERFRRDRKYCTAHGGSNVTGYLGLFCPPNTALWDRWLKGVYTVKGSVWGLFIVERGHHG